MWAILIGFVAPPLEFAAARQDTPRTIVSDDFAKHRPKGKLRRRAGRKSSKSSEIGFAGGRSYRLASDSSTWPAAQTSFAIESQVGLTFWKLRRVGNDSAIRTRLTGKSNVGWISERVEADTKFQYGDYLRLSIESPRAGYLYVIDRDWLTDGALGETKMIFPIRGDDNRVHAGKLIDIPAQDQEPFRARPEAKQLGEILTIIVTASPLDLPISDEAVPISSAQLMQWEEMWSGPTKRFEMQHSIGQARTSHEDQAAARRGTRQLTRDDPPPQTIYVLSTKDRSALLFNVKIAYGR
jgi:hypothetical protein